MEKHYSELNITEIQKNQSLADAVKLAAEVTHSYMIVSNKIQQLDKKLLSNDKKYLWSILQEYIKQYYIFITITSPLTGLTIIQANYDNLSVDAIKWQLNQMKTIIIICEILKTTLRKNFIECLKKCLLGTKNFSKEELSLLF